MAPTNIPAYTKDERALCFHHELLYEAKVLEFKYSDAGDKKSPILYRVHYKGWKNTWDDWVPQDRLRKFTEENKELAQDLRQTLKQELENQRVRAAPKSAARKKAAGSDFSSIRGSEERHSSVPVTGRGTKRGRDLDLEKVGPQFSLVSGYYSLDCSGSSPSASGWDSGYSTGDLSTPLPPKRRKTSSPDRASPLGLDGAEDSDSSLTSLSTLESSADETRPSEPPAAVKTEERKGESHVVPENASGRTRRPTAKAAARQVVKTLTKPANVTKDTPKKAPRLIKRRLEKLPEKLSEAPVEKPQKPSNESAGPSKKAAPAQSDETTEIPYSTAPNSHLRGRNIMLNPSFPQEEAFHTRPAIRLPIPDHIKALLVDDWENVTKNLSLVPLPAAHPVSEILTAYHEEEKLRRRPGSVEFELLEEVCAGLREYFDSTLGMILLYRFEREQWFQVRGRIERGEKGWEGKGPSEVYGAEHLCRLFVTLPELIAQTNMDHQAVNRLREELAKITSWLGKNSRRFFVVEYDAATPEYIEKARGAE